MCRGQNRRRFRAADRRVDSSPGTAGSRGEFRPEDAAQNPAPRWRFQPSQGQEALVEDVGNGGKDIGKRQHGMERREAAGSPRQA